VTATPNRIAIRAPNWLGDVILSLPALRDVRHAFPSAFLGVVARSKVATLYQAVPEVDAVLSADGLFQEVSVLRGDFDLGVLLPNSFGTALAVALAGIPERWGYATQGRTALLTRHAPVPLSVGGRSQVHYYRAMLAAMGLPTSDGLDTSIVPPAAWIETGRALLGPGRFLGIAPGAAKGTAKQWPPDRFAVAADRLNHELGTSVVLLGAKEDASAAASVAAVMKTPAKNLCGRTDLSAFVGVVASLEGLVANDSGAMHLGASLGIPTVGVFGPTNPDETHPVGPRAAFVRGVAECSPCRHAVCPIDHRCLLSVEPKAVVEALLQEVRS
jgi:heptosyltransferase-2